MARDTCTISPVSRTSEAASYPGAASAQFAPEFADQVLGAGEGAARKPEPVSAAGAAARGRFQVENHVVSRNPPQEAVRQREAFGVELDVQQTDRAAVRKTVTRMALNEKEIPRRNRIFDSVDDRERCRR